VIAKWAAVRCIVWLDSLYEFRAIVEQDQNLRVAKDNRENDHGDSVDAESHDNEKKGVEMDVPRQTGLCKPEDNGSTCDDSASPPAA
jgi:hypothetical protein